MVGELLTGHELSDLQQSGRERDSSVHGRTKKLAVHRYREGSPIKRSVCKGFICILCRRISHRRISRRDPEQLQLLMPWSDYMRDSFEQNEYQTKVRSLALLATVFLPRAWLLWALTHESRSPASSVCQSFIRWLTGLCISALKAFGGWHVGYFLFGIDITQLMLKTKSL